MTDITRVQRGRHAANIAPQRDRDATNIAPKVNLKKSSTLRALT